MDIEKDLIEKEYERKDPEYREIFDSDIKKMMLNTHIFNQDNKPYETYEEYNKRLESIRSEYSDNDLTVMYMKSKESYERHTGQRYIFIALHSNNSKEITLTIQRLFEEEFETIKDKYLISNSSTSETPYLKLKD